MEVHWTKEFWGSGRSHLIGLVGAVAVVGVVCFGLSLIGVWRLPESYGRDLDFIEK